MNLRDFYQKLMTEIDIREVHQDCECGHHFKVSIVGLSSVTDIVCPACCASWRLSGAQIAEIRENWGKFAREVPHHPQVADVKRELAKKWSVPVAEVLP